MWQSDKWFSCKWYAWLGSKSIQTSICSVNAVAETSVVWGTLVSDSTDLFVQLHPQLHPQLLLLLLLLGLQESSFCMQVLLTFSWLSALADSGGFVCSCMWRVKYFQPIWCIADSSSWGIARPALSAGRGGCGSFIGNVCHQCFSIQKRAASRNRPQRTSSSSCRNSTGGPAAASEVSSTHRNTPQFQVSQHGC